MACKVCKGCEKKFTPTWRCSWQIFCSRECGYEHSKATSLKRYYNAKDKLHSTVDYRVRFMMRSCKQRAKKKGVPFNLTFDYLKGIWDKQDGKCALTRKGFCFIP